MKLNMYMDKKSQFSKPSSQEIKRISNSILNNSVNIDILDLAMEIGYHGKTVVLSELDGKSLNKNTPIKEQRVIMLDFDNKDESQLYNIDDLENDKFMQENACFYYRTFSDSKSNHDKFRVVFVLDKKATTNIEVEEIYKKLFSMYPMSDTSIGQTSRLFFGSNRGYKIINKENRLIKSKLKLKKQEINNVHKNLVIDDSLPIYELFKLKQYKIIARKLKEIYGDELNKLFPDEYSALSYFRTLDIREFLELPSENPFLDIFHDESNPSASIYFSDELNVYFYKCFSEGKELTFDLINALIKLGNIRSSAEVLLLLIKITGVEIDNSSELGLNKLNSNIFRKNLTTGMLQRTHPEIYNYIKHYTSEINATIDLMYDHIYLDKNTGEVQYLNYYSFETLRKQVSNSLKQNISVTKMWNVLNTIVVTEMIQKLGDSEIPEDLYKKIIIQQKENDNIRRSNVYATNNLDDKALKHTTEIVNILKENNVTISSLSYEIIYRLFGEKKANNDFPQTYKPLQEKGLVKMSSQDKNLTRKQINFENKTIKIIEKQISENGYILEETLIKDLAKSNRTKIDTTKKSYVKIRADICNKYGLERKRMTKELHKSLNVKEKFTTKTVLYR